MIAGPPDFAQPRGFAWPLQMPGPGEAPCGVQTDGFQTVLTPGRTQTCYLRAGHDGDHMSAMAIWSDGWKEVRTI